MEWAGLIAFTWANVADANAAAEAWQKGDRSAVVEILARNPNVGMQVDRASLILARRRGTF